jgi:MoxR-like ATPase
MGQSVIVLRLRANLNGVIRGKSREIDLLITSFLAGGHLLLTDVPGVGKTTLAKAVAASIGGTFHRIQFTPDLLPADVTGGSIYNPREGTFEFRPGPVFANIVLADEINRASPRTQSSLLEAMAEGQVTNEGTSRKLPEPFWVIATQNPVEHHGTYPLPEAQLDRFAAELTLGYPPEEEELKILGSRDDGAPLDAISAITSPEEIIAARDAVRHVHVDEDVRRYVVAILKETRSEPRLDLGVSPRGGLSLYRQAQARAYMDGRDNVLPDDVKALAVSVLSHRIMLETKAKYSGVSKAAVIGEILERVNVPV